MLTGDCAREAVENYGDMLYRICLVMLKNSADAEDAVPETFITYIQKSPEFESDGHKKAWLITVATNKCRDMLRYRTRHQTESEEAMYNYAVEKSDSGIIEALMELPDKYRIVLMLHYVEEYKVHEISKLIDSSISAVKMRLSRGRKLLEEKYRKEYM